MKCTDFDNPISSAWVERYWRRLSSKPYLSGAIEARILLDKLPAEKEPLYKITRGIYHAGREGRSYVNHPEFGVPFLGSTDILAADLSFLPLLSKKQVAANPLFLLQEGWTLITRSGTIGRMAFVRSDMAGMACTEDVMRVVPDPDQILPGYLYTYLSSNFGRPLVVEGTYGQVIQHIEPQHIADLPVPIAQLEIQKKAHELITEMAQLRVAGVAGYQQATEQILNSIGIVEPQRHTWLGDKSGEAFSVTQLSSKTPLLVPCLNKTSISSTTFFGEHARYIGSFKRPRMAGVVQKEQE
jgi:type I restriction enzyme S subunit